MPGSLSYHPSKPVISTEIGIRSLARATWQASCFLLVARPRTKQSAVQFPGALQMPHGRIDYVLNNCRYWNGIAYHGLATPPPLVWIVKRRHNLKPHDCHDRPTRRGAHEERRPWTLHPRNSNQAQHIYEHRGGFINATEQATRPKQDPPSARTRHDLNKGGALANRFPSTNSLILGKSADKQFCV